VPEQGPTVRMPARYFLPYTVLIDVAGWGEYIHITMVEQRSVADVDGL